MPGHKAPCARRKRTTPRATVWVSLCCSAGEAQRTGLAKLPARERGGDGSREARTHLPGLWVVVKVEREDAAMRRVQRMHPGLLHQLGGNYTSHETRDSSQTRSQLAQHHSGRNPNAHCSSRWRGRSGPYGRWSRRAGLVGANEGWLWHAHTSRNAPALTVSPFSTLPPNPL